MNAGIILYILAAAAMLVSIIKNVNKSKSALFKAWKMFIKLLPNVIAIMVFVGISLSVLTPDVISKILGQNSGILGIFLAGILGSVAIIPSFVVFPMGATLYANGAGLPQVAILMNTLMSVGVATFPVEQSVFGKRFAIARNLSAYLMALGFSFLIWILRL